MDVTMLEQRLTPPFHPPLPHRPTPSPRRTRRPLAALTPATTYRFHAPSPLLQPALPHPLPAPLARARRRQHHHYISPLSLARSCWLGRAGAVGGLVAPPSYPPHPPPPCTGAPPSASASSGPAHQDYGGTALMLAAREGHVGCVAELVRAGANLGDKDKVRACVRACVRAGGKGGGGV